MRTLSTRMDSSLRPFPFSQHELVSEEGFLQGWVSSDKTDSWEKHGKGQNANTTLWSNSWSKERHEEHFWCKLFGVTLGLLFATWTSTLHLTCDLMNSSREIRKKDLFLQDVYAVWMLDFISSWRKKYKDLVCYSLAGDSKLKELSFSSHKNRKQRLVRENCFMLRKIKCSTNTSVKYSVHLKSTPILFLTHQKSPKYMKILILPLHLQSLFHIKMDSTQVLWIKLTHFTC